MRVFKYDAHAAVDGETLGEELEDGFAAAADTAGVLRSEAKVVLDTGDDVKSSRGHFSRLWSAEDWNAHEEANAHGFGGAADGEDGDDGNSTDDYVGSDTDSSNQDSSPEQRTSEESSTSEDEDKRSAADGDTGDARRVEGDANANEANADGTVRDEDEDSMCTFV